MFRLSGELWRGASDLGCGVAWRCDEPWACRGVGGSGSGGRAGDASSIATCINYSFCTRSLIQSRRTIFCAAVVANDVTQQPRPQPVTSMIGFCLCIALVEEWPGRLALQRSVRQDGATGELVKWKFPHYCYVGHFLIR